MVKELISKLIERKRYLLDFMLTDEFAALKPVDAGMLMVEIRQVTSLLETYNTI